MTESVPTLRMRGDVIEGLSTLCRMPHENGLICAALRRLIVM